MWKRIETAPSDGEPVMLWAGALEWQIGVCLEGCWETLDGFALDGICVPTHWAELPEPPEEVVQ